MGREKGWHFYTRMVQLKFLKDFINVNKFIKLEDDILSSVQNVIEQLYISLKDHVCENENGKYIISSFDKDGKITKYEDSANLLAYCHIDFDKDIIKTIH